MNKFKGELPVVNEDGKRKKRLTRIPGGGASFGNKLEAMKLMSEFIESDDTCFDELREEKRRGGKSRWQTNLKR